MSDSMKQIAMRIEDLRESSDYTVEQMAEMLNVSAEEYRRYESGEVDMSISFLVKLSDVFNVDMTELLTGQAPSRSICRTVLPAYGPKTESVSVIGLMPCPPEFFRSAAR